MPKDVSELWRKLGRLSEEAGTPGGLAQLLAPELVGLALEAEGRAKQAATTRPRSRSGRLRQSIQGLYDADGGVLVLRAGGRVRGRSVLYARAQDIGATMRPRRGRYLAIPLRASKTAAGVPRYQSARFDPTPMYARRSKAGRLLLFARDDGPPRYLLHPGPVHIPGTGYLRDTARWVLREMDGAVGRALTAALRDRG